MPNKEKMTIDERRKYLRLIKKRYLKASKLERGKLLDEMEAITGLHQHPPGGFEPPGGLPCSPCMLPGAPTMSLTVPVRARCIALLPLWTEYDIVSVKPFQEESLAV